ncbi:conserved hypothetical protein [Tenacibaculum sp. 190524A02b]|uniref:Lipoprotein n=1 Tax=Tenacibaculum vairaonense TaxID=3137860 RepID=A0ABM9PQZ8_9FLAO
MKKLLLVIAGVLVFNSCTDTSLEEIENNQENKVQLIDKDEIQEPNDRDD